MIHATSSPRLGIHPGDWSTIKNYTCGRLSKAMKDGV